MPINEDTLNRGYERPHETNELSHDVFRLKAALDGIDVDVAALLATQAGKADLVHFHSIAEVSGLQAALDAKAAIAHSHALASLTDVDVGTPVTDQVLRFNGTTWSGAVFDASFIKSGVIDAARLPAHLTVASLAATYAAIGHNHDAVYAALGHNHNGVYGGLSESEVVTGEWHFNGATIFDGNTVFFRGPGGVGDSFIHFRDDENSLWRSLGWINANDDWYVEGDDNVLYRMHHDGNTAPPSTLTYTEFDLGTLSLPGPATAAHGLGGAPTAFMGYLECITADQGYSPGDRMFVAHGSSLHDKGINIFADATNVGYSAGATGLFYPHKTTGGAFGIAPGSWKIVIGVLN